MENSLLLKDPSNFLLLKKGRVQISHSPPLLPHTQKASKSKVPPQMALRGKHRQSEGLQRDRNEHSPTPEERRTGTSWLPRSWSAERQLVGRCPPPGGVWNRFQGGWGVAWLCRLPAQSRKLQPTPSKRGPYGIKWSPHLDVGVCGGTYGGVSGNVRGWMPLVARMKELAILV